MKTPARTDGKDPVATLAVRYLCHNYRKFPSYCKIKIMQRNNKLINTAKKLGTPIYLYDAEIIKQKCKELKTNLKYANLYYACKANTNTEIIKLIYKQGYGIETVSPGEISIARKAGVPVSKITFTCSNIKKVLTD